MDGFNHTKSRADRTQDKMQHGLRFDNVAEFSRMGDVIPFVLSIK